MRGDDELAALGRDELLEQVHHFAQAAWVDGVLGLLDEEELAAVLLADVVETDHGEGWNQSFCALRNSGERTG